MGPAPAVTTVNDLKGDDHPRARHFAVWLGVALGAALTLLLAYGVNHAAPLLMAAAVTASHAIAGALLRALSTPRDGAFTVLQGTRSKSHWLRWFLAGLGLALPLFIARRLDLHTVGWVLYAAAAVLGAALGYAIAVHRLEARRFWNVAGGALGAICGLVVGALAVVILFGIMAWQRGHALDDPTIPDAKVTGIGGTYVALGDSYSAGEGLSPYVRGTGGRGTGCDQSKTKAYARLLRFDQPVNIEFRACSGAVTRDIYTAYTRGSHPVAAQVSSAPRNDVSLVTITIGGNDVLFAKVVTFCYIHGRCVDKSFEPPKVKRAELPPRQALKKWADAAVTELQIRVHPLYTRLRDSFPNARIVVIGYPYLFSARRATWRIDDCASALRRFSPFERRTLRKKIDRFNEMLSNEALSAGLEFVAPTHAWLGHEPCGVKTQYSNSLKPLLNFTNPVDAGSFHPTFNGQRRLAALIACYLTTHTRVDNPDLTRPPLGAPSNPFTC